jgi:2-amino-4-hydroxy-6-hydroxymethyldihydropteridine diphosphokinase
LNNCIKAIEFIDQIDGCSVKKRSRFYRTEPVGVEGQDWYVNGVVSVDTALSPRGLLTHLLAVESAMGRERKHKWDSRTIDLDILLFGVDAINESDLIVPHPLMHLRKFVLAPMVDMEPDLVHPVLRKTMIELARGIPDEGQTVVPLEAI